MNNNILLKEYIKCKFNSFLTLLVLFAVMSMWQFYPKRKVSKYFLNLNSNIKYLSLNITVHLWLGGIDYFYLYKIVHYICCPVQFLAGNYCFNCRICVMSIVHMEQIFLDCLRYVDVLWRFIHDSVINHKMIKYTWAQLYNSSSHMVQRLNSAQMHAFEPSSLWTMCELGLSESI